jgi:hypothetical protein
MTPLKDIHHLLGKFRWSWIGCFQSNQGIITNASTTKMQISPSEEKDSNFEDIMSNNKNDRKQQGVNNFYLL